MNVKIRPATLEDIPQITQNSKKLCQTVTTVGSSNAIKHLYKFSENPEKHWEKYFNECIESDDRFLQVVEDENGKLVGHMMVHVDDWPPVFANERIGTVRETYLDEEYRGKGLALKLFEGAEKFFRKKGLRFIQIEFDEGNTRAEGAYRKMGFDNFKHKLVKELK